MKLVPKYESREKILLFGWGKVGKSTAILSLAERNTDDTFYILDTEGKMAYTLERNVGKLANVVIKDISETKFSDVISLVAEIRQLVKPDDWLVVDSISETWSMLANQVSERKFGATKEDYWEQLFVEKPQANMRKEGGLDLPYLQVINPTYFKFYTMLKKWPSHVLATAMIDQVDDNDREGVRKAFGGVGVKPKGQKDLYFAFHEVLLLEKDKNDVHKMSSFGTSSGVQFRDVEFTDWAKDYLWMKAGWEPEK